MIPNGVELPPEADPAGRENRIVFLGRHDPRKGLPVLLRAWPRLSRNGLRLRVIGADPLAVRLLMTRQRIHDAAIDVLGYVSDDELTEELSTAKLLVAPSLGNESFGMILTRAFACSTPVVASDIPGYAEVVTPETGALAPPDDPDALAATIEAVLANEPARVEKGRAAPPPRGDRVRVAAPRPAARRIATSACWLKTDNTRSRKVVGSALGAVHVGRLDPCDFADRLTYVEGGVESASRCPLHPNPRGGILMSTRLLLRSLLAWPQSLPRWRSHCPPL